MFNAVEWVLIIVVLITVIYLLFQVFRENIINEVENPCKNQYKGKCVETREECDSEQGKAYKGMGCGDLFCCVPMENIGLI